MHYLLSVFKLISEFIGKYNVDKVIALMFFTLSGIFVLLTYMRLKAKGFFTPIDRASEELIRMFKSFLDKMEINIQLLVAQNKKIVESNSDMIAILKDGYLPYIHTEIVRDYVYGRKDNLKNQLFNKIMKIYEGSTNGEFKGNIRQIRKIIKAEIRTTVTQIDNDIFKIPNIEHNTPHPMKKSEIFDDVLSTIVSIMKDEKKHEEVRRRIKDVIESIIVTNKF